MFGRKPKVEPPDLTAVIDKLLEELDQHDPNSEDFAAAMNHLDRVMQLSSKDKRRIDPNTIVLAVGGILQVLAIVIYEQKHVFTSKGLGFISKSNTQHH